MISCIWSLLVICTSNVHNLKQCLPVWDYIPAYYHDYRDFKDNTIYYREKVLLNEARSR